MRNRWKHRMMTRVRLGTRLGRPVPESVPGRSARHQCPRRRMNRSSLRTLTLPDGSGTSPDERRLLGSFGKRVPGTVVFVSSYSPEGLGLAPFVLAVASVSPLLDRTDGEDEKGRPPFV